LEGDARDKFDNSLGPNEKSQASWLPDREYPVTVRMRDRVTAATDSSDSVKLTRYAMYAQRTVVAPSRNHSCRGKATTPSLCIVEIHVTQQYKQHRQCTCNATLFRVRATVVDMETQRCFFRVFLSCNIKKNIQCSNGVATVRFHCTVELHISLSTILVQTYLVSM
jgi:hypothetical protein